MTQLCGHHLPRIRNWITNKLHVNYRAFFVHCPFPSLPVPPPGSLRITKGALWGEESSAWRHYFHSLLSVLSCLVSCLTPMNSWHHVTFIPSENRISCAPRVFWRVLIQLQWTRQITKSNRSARKKNQIKYYKTERVQCIRNILFKNIEIE